MADATPSTFELDARLQVTASEHGQVRQFPIGLPTVEGMELIVGRSRSADLTLHDDFISNRHLKIVFRKGQHWVEDQGSTHGTQVNGSPAPKMVALTSGDVIEIGKSTLEYLCTKRSIAPMAKPAPTPPPATPQAAAKPEPADTMEGKTMATRADAQQPPKPAPKPAPPVAPGAKPQAAEGGVGFFKVALAFLMIVGILALVSYLAWQLFFQTPGTS